MSRSILFFGQRISTLPSHRALPSTDGDGLLEAFVTGNGFRNKIYKYNSATGIYDQLLEETSLLADTTRKAIGVAACDVDGDGREEIYVLNMDSYSGAKVTTDRLFDVDPASGSWDELFALEVNQDAANYVAGRWVYGRM